ncbi:MAG TPA: hypothetical protein VGN12_06875 [Pirellulales bacterium]
MEIACLGWGSLVWDPKDLPIRSPWFSDGPFLPIEFARIAKDERVTLVLSPNARPVRIFFALLSPTDLEEAKCKLAKRERFDDFAQKPNNRIGCILKKPDSGSIEIAPRKEIDRSVIEKIRLWLGVVGMDAVIWTNSKPKMSSADKIYRKPTLPEVIRHLHSLPDAQKKAAEEYIRKTPRQIDTEYRRQIASEFDWWPIGDV